MSNHWRGKPLIRRGHGPYWKTERDFFWLLDQYQKVWARGVSETEFHEAIRGLNAFSATDYWVEHER